MRPFNLPEALAGAPLVTRDGRKVHRFRDNPIENVVWPFEAMVSLVEGDIYDSDGRAWLSKDSPLDLFMADTEESK